MLEGIVALMETMNWNIYNQFLEEQMENSEQFHPPSDTQSNEQRYGRPKQQQKYVSGQKNGKWSQKQNTQYIVYIEFHKDKMRSKQKRRVNKLYKEMARFIGTRNALQCRSHHQKLQDRYLYPNKIIANFKQHNDLTLYNEVKLQLESYQARLSKIDEPHLKLQKQNVQNPTYPELRVSQPNSANTSQQSSSSQVYNQNIAVSWMVNPPSIIPLDVAQINTNWSQFIYYPMYQIY